MLEKIHSTGAADSTALSRLTLGQVLYISRQLGIDAEEHMPADFVTQATFACAKIVRVVDERRDLSVLFKICRAPRHGIVRLVVAVEPVAISFNQIRRWRTELRRAPYYGTMRGIR